MINVTNDSDPTGTASAEDESGDDWLSDDATWILCSSFIIFTMQTGNTFGSYLCNIVAIVDPGPFWSKDEWEFADNQWAYCTYILTLPLYIHDFSRSGFGMLESGCVSLKNEVNIMMKNVVDVVLGGITYWAFGYGLSYGKGPWTNMFFGFGDWYILYCFFCSLPAIALSEMTCTS